MSEVKVILSLCDFTGNWSRPYAEDSDYEVIQVDLQHGQDVRTLMKPKWKIHGILAAPPCTMFAGSGARWERTRSQMLEALAIVDSCFRQVVINRPKWWVLENPIGKLSRYIGPARCTIHPWYYGDAYEKTTCLWGDFVPPPPTNIVEPEGKIKGQPSSWYSQVGGKSLYTKNVRSQTPMGFAHAFKLANP